MKSRTRESGFTLVELLVVIGIIALLISVLMPSLTNARRAAVAIQCSSTMRQLGAMMSMYTNANRGQTPPVWIDYNKNNVVDHLDETMFGHLWSYAGYQRKAWVFPSNDFQVGNSGYNDRNIFIAPERSQPGVIRYQLANPATWADSGFSYCYNYVPLARLLLPKVASLPAANQYPAIRASSISVSMVKTSSQTAMFLEGTNSYGRHYDWMDYFGLTPHNRSTNVLFFDGHVEPVRYTDIPRSYVNADDPTLKTFWSGR